MRAVARCADKGRRLRRYKSNGSDRADLLKRQLEDCGSFRSSFHCRRQQNRHRRSLVAPAIATAVALLLSLSPLVQFTSCLQKQQHQLRQQREQQLQHDQKQPLSVSESPGAALVEKEEEEDRSLAFSRSQQQPQMMEQITHNALAVTSVATATATATATSETAVEVTTATTSTVTETTSQSPYNQPLSKTSEDSMKFPLYMRIFATIACIVIFTIGVCGNLLVPLVVIKTKYLRNSTNLFLINLSVADLLVLIVCMPTVLIELHSKPETWLLGERMCKLSNFVEMLAANGSIFTILAISFERYYAICKPLKAGYKCTRLRATIIICTIWLLSSLLTSPILMMAKSLQTTYIDGSLVYNCILETDTYWHKAYVFVSMFAFFCLPLIVLMLVYWLIGRRLFRENILAKSTTTSLATSESNENTSSVLANNFKRISFRKPLSSLFQNSMDSRAQQQNLQSAHHSQSHLQVQAQLQRPQQHQAQQQSARQQQLQRSCHYKHFNLSQQSSGGSYGQTAVNLPVLAPTEGLQEEQIIVAGSKVFSHVHNNSSCASGKRFYSAERPAQLLPSNCVQQQQQHQRCNVILSKPPRLAARKRAFSLDHGHNLLTGNTDNDSGNHPVEPCRGPQATNNRVNGFTGTLDAVDAVQRRIGCSCTNSNSSRSGSSISRKSSASSRDDCRKLANSSSSSNNNNDNAVNSPGKMSLANQFVYQLLHIKSKNSSTKTNTSNHGANGFGTDCVTQRGNRTMNCCATNSKSSSSTLASPPLLPTSESGGQAQSKLQTGANVNGNGTTTKQQPADSTDTQRVNGFSTQPTVTVVGTTNSCLTTGSEQSCNYDQGSKVPFLTIGNTYEAGGGGGANLHEAPSAYCDELVEIEATTMANTSANRGRRRQPAALDGESGRLVCGTLSQVSGRRRRHHSGANFIWARCAFKRRRSSVSSSPFSTSSSFSSSSPPTAAAPATAAAATLAAQPKRSVDQLQLLPQQQQQQSPRPIIHCNGPQRGAGVDGTLRDRCPSERKKFAHFNTTLEGTEQEQRQQQVLVPIPVSMPPKTDTPASEISSLSPLFCLSESPSRESIFEQKVQRISGTSAHISELSANYCGELDVQVGESVDALGAVEKLATFRPVIAQPIDANEDNDNHGDGEGNDHHHHDVERGDDRPLSAPKEAVGFDSGSSRESGRLIQLEVAATTLLAAATGCDNMPQIGNQIANNDNENSGQKGENERSCSSHEFSPIIDIVSSTNDNHNNSSDHSEKFKSSLPVAKPKSMMMTDHNNHHHHFHFSLRRSFKKRSGSQPMVCGHFQQQHQQNSSSSPGGGNHLSEILVVQDLSKKQQMESRRQVVIMLAFVVTCFFLLFFPYRVFTIWLILSTDDQVQSLGMETYYNLTYFSRILIYLHSAINPIAYNLISTKFRRAFTSILFCRGSSTRRHFITEHRIINNKALNYDQRRSLRHSTLTSPSREVFK